MRKLHDWVAIQRFYDEGYDAVRCQESFDVTDGAWRMAIRRSKLRIRGPMPDGRRRHDWQLVQAHYDAGHTFYDCMRRFKFSRGAWHKALRRGEIRTRPLGRPIETLLATGRSRRNIKIRLLNAGLLENRCERCGLSEWRGMPLVVQIDHINGVRNDHRLENLRMLCPNCHSQTETYGRRNGKQARIAR